MAISVRANTIVCFALPTILAAFGGAGASAQHIGIGNTNPQAPLHVSGTVMANHFHGLQTAQFDTRMAINAPLNVAYRLYVGGGNTFLDGNLQVANDGIIDNNFRVNGRVGINGPTNASIGLYVNNSNSFFQGNATVSGLLAAQANLNVGNNLQVTNDAIVSGNFRTNGRAGIGGPTSASYALYVHDDSYVQGNLTATGTVAASGNLTIKGSGHVRSGGNSNLRIGFSSKVVDVQLAAGGAVSVTANILDFTGTTDNARVMVSQVVNDPSGSVAWPNVTITVMGVNSNDNTCLLWLKNTTNVAGNLKGTIYLTTIARE